MLRSARPWAHGAGPAPPEGVRCRGQVLPLAAAQSRRAAAADGARGAAAPAAHRPLPAGTGGSEGRDPSRGASGGRAPSAAPRPKGTAGRFYPAGIVCLCARNMPRSRNP